MTREYPIRTSARSGVLIVQESAAKVLMRLTFDRYGELGDEREIARQLAPLLTPYDGDHRPVELDAPDIGANALIHVGRDNRPFAVLSVEERH